MIVNRRAMHQDRHCKVGTQSLRSTFLHQISVSKGQLVFCNLIQKRDSFSMQTFPSVLSLPTTILSWLFHFNVNLELLNLRSTIFHPIFLLFAMLAFY